MALCYTSDDSITRSFFCHYIVAMFFISNREAWLMEV